MLTLEQRIQYAIIKTIVQSHSFIRKDAAQIKEMLHEWGVHPYKDISKVPEGPVRTIKEAMPDNAALNALIQKAVQYTKGGYSFRSNVFEEEIVPSEELRLVLSDVLRKGEVYDFFDIIRRYPPGVTHKGCWDCNSPLVGGTSLPFDILWFLIGPSVRMRQGKLCQPCIENRTRAITEGKGYAIKT